MDLSYWVNKLDENEGEEKGGEEEMSKAIENKNMF